MEPTPNAPTTGRRDRHERAAPTPDGARGPLSALQQALDRRDNGGETGH